jgi:hypothetical protein
MSIIEVREIEGVALADLLRKAMSQASAAGAPYSERPASRAPSDVERPSQMARRVRAMTPPGPQSDSVEIIRSMRNE